MAETSVSEVECSELSRLSWRKVALSTAPGFAPFVPRGESFECFEEHLTILVFLPSRSLFQVPIPSPGLE